MLAVVAAAFVVLPSSLSAATSGPSVDFDGDGASDVAVWRPSTTTWFVRGGATMQLGAAGDVPVPADYDGDGKSEFAVWRPSTGMWLIAGRSPVQWGVSGDVPVAGDFDGNGSAEIAVWRPSNGVWYVRGGATTQWGLSKDVPVPADYDGDGKTDIAVWRPSTGVWWILGGSAVQWGVPTDLPVTGDYDGDGRSDIAVWRPSDGTWFVRGIAATQWGVSGDVPVPADYNGDRKTDVAVWRPSTGVWYLLGNSPLQWGVPTDVPLAENAAAAAPTGPPPDTTAPSTPTNLRLTARTTSSITVAWNASTDDVGIAGYGRYRNSTLVSTGTELTYTFGGLTCGTSYPLAVDAVDQAGNRSAKATLTIASASCPADSTPPSVPQGLHTASATQSTITLAWNAATDNVGVVGYHLYNANVRVASTPNLSYTFTGLSCGTQYTLALEAYDAAGNVSYRPQAVAITSTTACSPDGQAPTTPTGLATSGITSSSVTVSWSASSDNIGVTGYGRYSNGSLVSSGTGTSYSFTGLACNTAYTFGIDAYDAAGNRSARASVNASTSACPAAPVPPPPGSANLWIDTNGGSCARQSSAGAYGDAQACGSFAAAYGAAASGDVIRVRAGSYGAQFFAGGVGSSQPRGTKTLTFIGEPGNIVRQIHFGSSGLVFDGFRVDAGGTQTSGAAFENSGGSFLFKNGSIGNVLDQKGAMLNGPNMVFDNVLFHDVVIRGAGVHLECIMALWNQGMVIRNSTFRNCGIMSASIGIGDYWSPPPPPYTNVTLENNYWGTSRTENSSCCAAYTLALWATKVPVGSDYGVLHDWRIVNNYFEPGSGVIVRPRDDGTNVICGNSGRVPSASWAVACP